MGALYNLCFSSIIFIRTYIHNIVYIIRFVNMFNLCFGFDLAKRSVSPFIGSTLLYVTNFHGKAARDIYLGLLFIVSLCTCGCWYVNGTFLVSTGKLSYIVKFSFRLRYHNCFGIF